MDNSLKNKTVKSVLWSGIERFSVQGIQFILTIIIARLVLPSDYGLIAMLGIFISIGQSFIDSGFSNALVQKQDRNEVDYATVFYFNIFVGIIFYFLLFILSPYIAAFYNEALLEPLTKLISLNLIVSAFAVVQRAKLTVALNFKMLSISSLCAVAISGIIGIIMAYQGRGVWAIATQSLINNLLCTIILWILVKWVPKHKFSYSSFKALFGFGSKLLVSGLIHTIYTNSYNIIIGKFFSSLELGFYNRAYTIAYMPSTNFSYIITRGIYPILCTLQNDESALQKYFIRSLRTACYLISPIMIGLCILSKPLVSLLLTDKWLPMVPYLQILSIAYLWSPMMDINNNLVNSKGFANYFLYAEIQKKICAIIILAVTIPFGVKIMCYGLIIYSLVDWYLISRYSKKIISFSFFCQIKELSPILLLNVAIGLIMYFVSNSIKSTSMQLLISIIVSTIAYCSFTLMFNMKEAKLLISFKTSILNRISSHE